MNEEFKKFIQEEVKKLHQITLLENKKIQIEKELKILEEGKNAELIRHYKVTYDKPVDSKNCKETKRQVIWLDKKTNIKGKHSDEEIRELNLSTNQEVFPSNN
jgi:hypothetical protein